MAELSRDEVIEIVGPIGDVIVAEIIATGISKVPYKDPGDFQRIAEGLAKAGLP